MSFKDDNGAYEQWLHNQCTVVEADLDHKHKRMRKNAFSFLRATFFRWTKKIESICPELKDAPAVLSVGDVHTENFGTWRDADSRLVWGINDFDEASVIPYPFDLVRLTTSAYLAPGLKLATRDVAEAIATGYGKGIVNPRPTLLDEQAIELRSNEAATNDDRRAFWTDVAGYPDAEPPQNVKAGFTTCLPRGAEVQRYATRRKGGGSLGRPRYVAIARWQGGTVVREAKALVPSAWDWAHGTATTGNPAFVKIATDRYRSPDPFLRVETDFIFRRIAANARKIELGDTPGALLTPQLLEAMGFDIGAIHAAAETKIAAIRDDFRSRPKNWLADAAKAAAASVEADYASWAK